MNSFFRYPHTPHLAWLGETPPRNDKVLSPAEAQAVLAGCVVVEEKLDGANLGVSVAEDGLLRFQNRGGYLATPYTGQFSRLNAWAAQHEHALVTQLRPGLVLFGEWMAARHTVSYSSLPDWFVVFDMHSAAEGRFWSVEQRDEFARSIGLSVAPLLARGQTKLCALTRVVAAGDSRFGDGGLEGVIVRRDGTHFNEIRAKLVRPGFHQAIGEHWRRRAIEWNRVHPA